MNKLYRLAMVTGLGALLGVAPSWAAAPVCVPPGCNPTVSDSDGNTAGGLAALKDNIPNDSSGDFNTAFGDSALQLNTTGGANAAFGGDALLFNISGSDNTASGEGALLGNSSGDENTASGYGALSGNSSGNQNTAVGSNALENNGTGGNNIAIGFNAGNNLTTGSNNIDIGNSGSGGESNTIRIGTNGTQAHIFVAGIYEKKVGTKHCSVLVDSDGRLGCGSSKVVDTSMLLNELQKQAAQMAAMKASMRRQAAELKASHERELAMQTAFEERLSRLEQVMASKNGSHNLAAAFNR